jgi:hypothetical protein
MNLSMHELPKMSLVSHPLEETIHLLMGPSTYRDAVISKLGPNEFPGGKSVKSCKC